MYNIDGQFQRDS